MDAVQGKIAIDEADFPFVGVHQFGIGFVVEFLTEWALIIAELDDGDRCALRPDAWPVISRNLVTGWRLLLGICRLGGTGLVCGGSRWCGSSSPGRRSCASAPKHVTERQPGDKGQRQQDSVYMGTFEHHHAVWFYIRSCGVFFDFGGGQVGFHRSIISWTKMKNHLLDFGANRNLVSSAARDGMKSSGRMKVHWAIPNDSVRKIGCRKGT